MVASLADDVADEAGGDEDGASEAAGGDADADGEVGAGVVSHQQPPTPATSKTIRTMIGIDHLDIVICQPPSHLSFRLVLI